MNKIKNSCKGFTLLELLVAVLIIGILAGIALPQYRLAVAKSRFATLKNATKALAEAEDRYFLVHNKYTADIEQLDIDIDYTDTSCNEQKTQCKYYIDNDGKMRIALNITGPQTFGFWQINSSTKIAFIYEHSLQLFRCVPYADSGLSWDICKSDGTSWDNTWDWVYK